MTSLSPSLLSSSAPQSNLQSNSDIKDDDDESCINKNQNFRDVDEYKILLQQFRYLIHHTSEYKRDDVDKKYRHKYFTRELEISLYQMSEEEYNVTYETLEKHVYKKFDSLSKCGYWTGKHPPIETCESCSKNNNETRCLECWWYYSAIECQKCYERTEPEGPWCEFCIANMLKPLQRHEI